MNATLLLLLACRGGPDAEGDDELVDDAFVEIAFDDDDDVLRPHDDRHDLALEVVGLDAWERETVRVVVAGHGRRDREAAQVIQGRVAVFFADVLERRGTHALRWWIDRDEDGRCDADEPADATRLVDVTADVVLVRTLRADTADDDGTCRDVTWDLPHSP